MSWLHVCVGKVDLMANGCIINTAFKRSRGNKSFIALSFTMQSVGASNVGEISEVPSGAEIRLDQEWHPNDGHQPLL